MRYSCIIWWQRRGYASLNGVVSAISIETGKSLSYECLVKKCKSCEMWDFVKGHECPINHVGSAGAMAASGVKVQPYGPDKEIVKGECVGHVQKRVGGRLRRFKKKHGGDILADDKKLGGAGRLNEKWR